MFFFPSVPLPHPESFFLPSRFLKSVVKQAIDAFQVVARVDAVQAAA
jgi:hypothetical protein